MRRVIREVITLIRIERWLVTDDSLSASSPAGADEHVLEQIVLNDADEAQIRELFRRILEDRQWELRRGDTPDHQA